MGLQINTSFNAPNIQNNISSLNPPGWGRLNSPSMRRNFTLFGCQLMLSTQKILKWFATFFFTDYRVLSKVKASPVMDREVGGQPQQAKERLVRLFWRMFKTLWSQ